MPEIEIPVHPVQTHNSKYGEARCPRSCDDASLRSVLQSLRPTRGDGHGRLSRRILNRRTDCFSVCPIRSRKRSGASALTNRFAELK